MFAAWRGIENHNLIAALSPTPWRCEGRSASFDHQVHLIARPLDMGGLSATINDPDGAAEQVEAEAGDGARTRW